MLQICSILGSHFRGKTALSQSSIYIMSQERTLIPPSMGHGPASGQGPAGWCCDAWAHAHASVKAKSGWRFCQNLIDWGSGSCPKGKEVGVRCVLCQKNEGKEAGQKIYLGPHHMPTASFSVIQNWWKTQKTTFTGTHCQECCSSPKSWLLIECSQVYHFHTLLSLLTSTSTHSRANSQMTEY